MKKYSLTNKILNIVTYLVALVVIGSIVINLFGSIKIHGLTPISLSIFILLYSFDKNKKVNKWLLYLISLVLLILGIIQIVIKF